MNTQINQKYRARLKALCLLAAAFSCLLASAAQGQSLPVAGINLAPVNSGGSNYPFADLMKQSNLSWYLNDDAWGDTVASSYIDANGYVTSMPNGTVQVSTRIAYDNKEFFGPGSNDRTNSGTTPGGRYVLRWSGSGTLHIGERGVSTFDTDTSTNTSLNVDLRASLSGYKEYQIAAGTQIKLVITSISASDYPRNIRCFLPDSSGAIRDNPSSPFNPQWLSNLRNAGGTPRFGVLRLMDWNHTNDSTQTTWASRKQVSHRSWAYTEGGSVPYEIMIDLANELDCDIWLCIPHAATLTGTDGHVQ